MILIGTVLNISDFWFAF